jgi:hypothetical protein
MRFIFVLIVSFVSVGAAANFDALMAAIRVNDLEHVREILVQTPALANQEDQFGIRPLFLASSPEMVQLLFNLGAYLREVEDYRAPFRMHCDAFGRNPLHYLLSITAQRLLRQATWAEHENVTRQIEATARLIMRINIQDDVQGQLVRIELQEDRGGNIPYAYIGNWGWTPEFLDRLGREYVLRERQLRRERELSREEAELTAINAAQPAAVQVVPFLVAPIARRASSRPQILKNSGEN